MSKIEGKVRLKRGIEFNPCLVKKKTPVSYIVGFAFCLIDFQKQTIFVKSM
jgi:hypothetical protein